MLLALSWGASPEDFLELDASYQRRHEAVVLESALERGNALLLKEPDNYDLLWRLARLEVWIAAQMDESGSKKRGARRAWELGDRARRLRPERAEGHYYAALGVGLWGEAGGIAASFFSGVATKFLERLNLAAALDPDLDRGGPLLAQARFKMVIPWPFRNMDQAKRLLEKVSREHPQNLRAKWYLHQLYQGRGDSLPARRLLSEIQASDESYDPAEARAIKVLALKAIHH